MNIHAPYFTHYIGLPVVKIIQVLFNYFNRTGINEYGAFFKLKFKPQASVRPCLFIEAIRTEHQKMNADIYFFQAEKNCLPQVLISNISWFSSSFMLILRCQWRQ